MFDRHWLEKTSSEPDLLLLYSIRQARFFLKHRTLLLLVETQEQAKGTELGEDYRRCRRLLDRSAAFWLATQELRRRQRRHGMGLLAPKPSLPLPRAFNLTRKQTFDLNVPWRQDEPFLRRVAFCSDALLAFGALVIPAPLEQGFIEKSFGGTAWEHILRQASFEKAVGLSQRWPMSILQDIPQRL